MLTSSLTSLCCCLLTWPPSAGLLAPLTQVLEEGVGTPAGPHPTMAVGHDVLLGASPMGKVHALLLTDNIQGHHNNPCSTTLLLGRMRCCCPHFACRGSEAQISWVCHWSWRRERERIRRNDSWQLPCTSGSGATGSGFWIQLNQTSDECQLLCCLW